MTQAGLAWAEPAVWRGSGLSVLRASMLAVLCRAWAGLEWPCVQR